MDKIQPLEGMLLFDASKDVHAAVLAGVALDGGLRVDNGYLLLAAGDGQLFARDDAHDGEEGPRWLPAFAAAAGVVMEDVRAEGYFDGVAVAVAVELASGEGRSTLGDAVVDEGVEGGSHGW